MTQISFEWRVDYELGDAELVEFSDEAGDVGLRRLDTSESLLAPGTALERSDVGTYGYDLDDPAEGLRYEYWVHVVYDGVDYWVQNFVDGEGLAPKTIRFALVKLGVAVAADDGATLTSPSGQYGVKRLDDGETVVAAGSSMTAVAAGLYARSFAVEDELPHRYRFYVAATVDGVDYRVPSVTTQTVFSACLAIGRYTDSYQVGQRFGHDNLHLWVGTPNYGGEESDEPADYVLRAYDFIQQAEQLIDDLLLGPYVSGPFEVDEDNGVVIPPLVARLARDLAGVLMYEARGVDDTDPDNPEASHRLSRVRKETLAMCRRIQMGLQRVSGSSSLTPGQEPFSGGQRICKPKY